MRTTPGKLGLLFGYLALASAITCGGKVTVDQGSASGDGGASAQSGSGTGNTGNASSQVNGAGGTGNASSQAVTAVAASAGPSSGTNTTTSVGPGSAAGGAGGGCSTCGDVIQGGGDPGDLCDESQKIFEAFIQCICDFGCPMQCQGACNGGNPSNQCQQCIQQQCDAELQDCFNDF